MHKKDIDELICLIGKFSPFCIPASSDWHKIEQELEIDLPLEYKDLLSIIGDGEFGFLFFLNPLRCAARQLTKEYILGYKDNWITEYDHIGCGVNLYPERDGYVLLCHIEMFGSLFFKNEKNNIVKYLYMEEDTGKHFFLNSGLSRFILDLYYKNNQNNYFYRVLSDYIWTNSKTLFTPHISDE